MDELDALTAAEVGAAIPDAPVEVILPDIPEPGVGAIIIDDENINDGEEVE